jgi:hypothetical protein
VLEIIEPDTTAASPPSTDRYILLANGPFAYLQGSEGEQYITATRRRSGCMAGDPFDTFGRLP